MTQEKWACTSIFVWPWNENARTTQKQQINGNRADRAIWLVQRTDTNARRLLVEWKGFTPEELSRNQSILRFDVILQHNWPIEQCLLHIRVFFGGKTKRPCFDLYIYWLTKQIITNTNRNHFSRSYENRSIDRANTNMSNRGRRGTRVVYYSSILAHSLKVSLFCNVISPQSPGSGLYCLVSHWNYDKPEEYFRVMPGHSPLATTAWHERQWAPRHKVI